MKIKKYNIRPEWFGAYGLDKEKNFMQAPTCECGCGGKGVLLINDRKELFGFIYNVLMEMNATTVRFSLTLLTIPCLPH